MKYNKIVWVVSVFLALALGNQASFGHTTLPSNVSMKAVIEKLNSHGYNKFHKIKFEDGIFKVSSINTDGSIIKLTVDPKSYNISQTKVEHNKKKQCNSKLSALNVITEVEKAGYHDVYKFECEKKRFEVKALDKDNKKTELTVNLDSGSVQQSGWFD